MTTLLLPAWCATSTATTWAQYPADVRKATARAARSLPYSDKPQSRWERARLVNAKATRRSEVQRAAVIEKAGDMLPQADTEIKVYIAVLFIEEAEHTFRALAVHSVNAIGTDAARSRFQREFQLCFPIEWETPEMLWYFCELTDGKLSAQNIYTIAADELNGRAAS